MTGENYRIDGHLYLAWYLALLIDETPPDGFLLACRHANRKWLEGMY
jgi:hypothetical protein